MKIFCNAFYVSFYALCSLDFGSRHRSPLGLDIACTLCTVGWPSRPYFTNSGMIDFTRKFDAEMWIVFLEAIQLTMSQQGEVRLADTNSTRKSLPLLISQTYYQLILSSKQGIFVMFFHQLAKILQNIMYSFVGQKEVNIMFLKDLYFVCNILKSGNLQKKISFYILLFFRTGEWQNENPLIMFCN